MQRVVALPGELEVHATVCVVELPFADTGADVESELEAMSWLASAYPACGAHT